MPQPYHLGEFCHCKSPHDYTMTYQFIRPRRGKQAQLVGVYVCQVCLRRQQVVLKTFPYGNEIPPDPNNRSDEQPLHEDDYDDYYGTGDIK